ncbi:MAG: protein-arginine deiminase [Labilithrix sp.]|nr:protein-arginine deiminase [Labilithrix sp.]MBX3220213.1 protein-arginine deiminase [Labilithrix sp.]
MRRVPRIFLISALFLVACGVETVPADSNGTPPADDPSGEGTGTGEKGPGTDDPSEDPDGEDVDEPPGGIVADLRADTNRDGVVSFDGKADDDGEDLWGAKHGAVFLANIDDDALACSSNLNDSQVASCNDAADDEVNGADDALDLARLKTKPWADAPSNASATITWTAGDNVRLFKVKGASFTVVESGMTLSASEVKSGIELAIEGKDIVRDPAEWDGFVDLTLKVEADGKTKSDEVRMRVAPLLTYHHLLPVEQTWVSVFNNAGNQAMRADLATALTAAGLPAVRGVNTQDSWNQDYFETGFMSMPAAGGKQHVIRVNIRSANVYSASTTNPLRPAGAVVWAQRGKDTAGIQQFNPMGSRSQRERGSDSLNSFGNLETVPPYTFNGKSYPLGRVIRGSSNIMFPDTSFAKMMEAQKVQPPIYVDTSWLVVGHIDETVSFVKANNARGWVMLVNDAAMARSMFQTRANAGQGNTPLHVGKFWTNGGSAQVTINQVLADTDVMAANAEAIIEVDAQVKIIKDETGLTNAEIVKVPFLHHDLNGASVAYQPGMVNGIYISNTRFVSPNPHGPTIGGQDIFKQAMSSALAPYNITVHFAENWDTYHRQLGEVHCGTNATRQIPQAKWWESGR